MSVLFPAPFSPTSATCSPGAMCRFRSLKTGFFCPGYKNVRLVIRMSGVSACESYDASGLSTIFGFVSVRSKKSLANKRGSCMRDRVPNTALSDAPTLKRAPDKKK
mgnify:CR=1 FL=1